MNVRERLNEARALLMNLDLSIDQEAALDSLLADAARHISNLERVLGAAHTRTADLERTLREIGALITPATAYEETVKRVHRLIGGVLGPAEYAARNQAGAE